MLFGSPPGWAALITCGVLAVGGILATGYKNEKANTIQILPLTRYGRPWIGGLEGYQITDFWYSLKNDFAAWTMDEIYPTRSLPRRAQHIFARAGKGRSRFLRGRILGPGSPASQVLGGPGPSICRHMSSSLAVIISVTRPVLRCPTLSSDTVDVLNIACCTVSPDRKIATTCLPDQGQGNDGHASQGETTNRGC